MKLLETIIDEHVNLKTAPRHIVEKDFILSYILAGISQHQDLSQSLVFKGGTALKKIYFGDYRFSEDLDFSTIHAPKGEKLQIALEEAAQNSRKLLQRFADFNLEVKRKPEREPHPHGQEAFKITVSAERRIQNQSIKIEITHDEPVILPPVSLPLLHNYSDEMPAFMVNCYHIEEIIAEKLRALLQTHEKLMARGWNRPRARDYYDLWRILTNHADSVNKARLIEVLQQKCAHRGITYSSTESFFTEQLIAEAQKHWQSNLQLQTLLLPDCKQVLTETKTLIQEILWQ